MQVYPLLDIHFDESKESELLAAMRSLAKPPWGWQPHNPFEQPPKDGDFYFHRDGDDVDPPCTLCMGRESPGHIVVRGIVPDADEVDRIPVDQYVRIINEFDKLIADPAANGLDGMTSIGTTKHTLEDHFSREAIRLLERFCSTSNAGDQGSHPSDQRKWIAFLLEVHANGKDVHCDTFGACLKAKDWWPEKYVDDLVHEYDFAMRLLQQANESGD